ncbi:MAG TPA: MBL fold metallo-hydrolase [Candidatus Acidoferrales bacterium]|jgi:glyoxylase-like metal-dependent hydrolase (beta-lactamase superfamily II)|nr:MBL fold metallo-hydrolase [Candidatus Acidoferrales bacterium]
MKQIEGLGALRKLPFALALALIFSGLAASVAQAQQAPQPLTVTKIKDNLYWARGGAGSNDGIIIGKDGVILVDTKTTPDSEKEVLAEVAKITPKMINTVIITHSDGDHVNGLAALPAGLTIIAQENCKKEMEASASSRNPAPQDRLPTKTYDKTDKLNIDGVKIQLYHWAPGHTSGDTIVYLPEDKVVFGGDLLVTNRPDTGIHMEKNGSAAGWIENAKGMLKLDADTYLTGHGDMMTKADVQKKLDLIQGKYDKIKAMVAQGKSLDEIKMSFGESTAPAPPNANGTPAQATLTEVIYKEVSKKS